MNLDLLFQFFLYLFLVALAIRQEELARQTGDRIDKLAEISDTLSADAETGGKRLMAAVCDAGSRSGKGTLILHNQINQLRQETRDLHESLLVEVSKRIASQDDRAIVGQMVQLTDALREQEQATLALIQSKVKKQSTPEEKRAFKRRFQAANAEKAETVPCKK